MKKKLSGKHKDHKGKKLSSTNRSKLHHSKKIEYVNGVPGPSSLITKDENGKVTITNVFGKVKQKDYTTKIGKSAQQENKTVKQAKKERIKQILTAAGFDPTIRYTRKEIKRFTRIVKNKLFIKPTPVNLTKEEIKARFTEEKAKKAVLLESRPYAKIKGSSVEYLMKVKKTQEEKQKAKKFRYVVSNKSGDNSMKDIDFYTDYVNAKDKEDALSKVKVIAKKYKSDKKFCGIRIEDLSTNNWTYYPKATLLAA